MDERIIETDADVAEGAAWLAAHEPRFAKAFALTGPLPLRRKADGFEQLLNAIVGQQISVAAANGIWTRLCDAGAVSISGINGMDDDALKACGLSRSKLRYARALCEADVDYAALRQMPSDVVIKELIQITGIGKWTAEIYAMFSLGRADVFAPGDLALQEAARILFDLEARPSEKTLREMAQDWSPWRAVAARGLFAYYRVAKEREGIR